MILKARPIAVHAHWRRADRSPLERYLGTGSLCRIDGPLQDAPADYPYDFILPSGGLIETPGVTAHLTPFEADAIWKRIQEAIEGEIVRWTSEQGLYDNPRLPPRCDEGHGDDGTVAQIADWTPDAPKPGTPHQSMKGGSDHE